jgi:NTP pyrophosphatase (non-canonical NTP hydrolase)
MNEKEHLLTVLSEECAEVAQRACKAARFGLSEIQPGQLDDNTRRLEREYAELIAVAELLGLHAREEDKAAKREKLKKFMDYSRKLGTLEDRSHG